MNDEKDPLVELRDNEFSATPDGLDPFVLDPAAEPLRLRSGDDGGPIHPGAPDAFSLDTFGFQCIDDGLDFRQFRQFVDSCLLTGIPPALSSAD
jgi:hypothetical protein